MAGHGARGAARARAGRTPGKHPCGALPCARPFLRVWALSLGCPKNRVDSERLLGSLGVDVQQVPRPSLAQLVFINTCGFIEPAVRESVRAVVDAVEDLHHCRRKPLLAVAGCLVGRYGQEVLARELPEVDIWLPTAQLPQWPKLVAKALALPEPSAGVPGGGRLLSTGPAYAWLKIGEGCDHHCAFCTIPSIRGPLRSLPTSAVVEEARCLLAQGVRELALVAQDVTSWGRDLGLRDGLPTLLEALAGLEGLLWLRLLYLYPSGITETLLQAMAALGPVLPYLDIPLQHAHPTVLQRMGRPFAADPRRVVARVRQALPQAALRTTFIVGYPGETEAQFAELCRFVEEVRFQHVGVFVYAAEEGTAAAALPDQIPEEIKERRRATLMELQADISAELLDAFVGTRQDVLVEAPHPEWPGLHTGRVWFQAPEVDGITYVSGEGVVPGAVVSCHIAEHTDYDLSALA